MKTQSFQKLFWGGHLFVFVEYLCNRNPNIKTKNIKNYSSILAIVNHRNWLNDSPPLSDFSHVLARVALAEWFRAPVQNPTTWIQLSTWPSLLSL